jgi:hypothetical protein
VSSFSSGSVRSSVSSSPRNHNRNTGASYTSSIPAINERTVSPHPYGAPSFKVPSVASTVTSRPRELSRSVSEYSIREHALNVRSFPKQVAASTPVYFCVHCGNGFEKRADWETHEWIFHERQSFWPCPQPGCQAFFDSGRAFEAHHQAVHGCGKCDHSSQVVQLLPERKAWSCGFKGCKEFFLDWSRRCKHVAGHYEVLAKRQGNFRESPEWTYSTAIRNLLRQPELRDPFAKFMKKCHGHSKSTWPILDWQPDKCAELQRCLEFRDFARGIPDVIHLAYRMGHPGYATSAQVASRPLTPPSSILSPPAVSPRTSSLRSRARSRSVRSAMSGSAMSPNSPPHLSSSGKSYLYERKVSGSVRASDTPSFVSGGSLHTTSPPLSPMRAPSILSPTSEFQRPVTANKKRMVAREPEVRGTSSQALLDFLNEGPPTGPTKGEHRARRVPRAMPLTPDAYGLGSTSTLSSPIEESVNAMPSVERKHSKTAHDFDRPVSPVTEEEEPAMSYDRPDYPFTMTPTAVQQQEAVREEQYESRDPPTPPQEDAQEVIQETVLDFEAPTFHAHYYGHKILPPTPGPPPSQLLPLPPPPSFSPPQFAYPDTPTTETGDVPPSPMPPGFTDISNWPAPPPSVVSHSPTTPQLPEVPAIHQIAVKQASVSGFSDHPTELPQRPRTANSKLQPEIVKLMPPPKRARSASRSRPRSLRWVNIGTMMEPPMPSPGIDFGDCLSQPLDLAQPGSPPAPETATVNV